MNTSSHPIAGRPRADTERSRPEASKSSVGAGDGDEDGRGVSTNTPQVPQLLRQFSAVSLKEHRLGSLACFFGFDQRPPTEASDVQLLRRSISSLLFLTRLTRSVQIRAEPARFAFADQWPLLVSYNR